MTSVGLLSKLAGLLLLVLTLFVVCLLGAGLILLPASDWRDRYLLLLILLGLVTGVVSFLILRLQERHLIQPLRELATAHDQFENDTAHAFTPVGGAIDDLADSFQRLQTRLALRIHQLEEDRQQLRAILSGMIEGVVALDIDQRVLFANERATNLLETDMATLVGRRIWEVVRQRPLLDVVQRALACPEPQEEEVHWNGDAERSLTVHAASLPGDPPRGAVVVLHDTSALRRLERLRQEFVANVSHELKTPLSVIKACVETLLERGAIDDARHRGHFLEQIATQSERLHLLILDLLALARIESGDQLLEFSAVPLALLVESCLEGHLTRATASKQTLDVVAPPEYREVEVWADEESLNQILHNLLDNALKYTPEGGRIEVAWTVEGRDVVLTVSDSGIGIPEADLPRVFERFYRVDKARSRQLGGTGLGLSIVKHLAQEMGGSVRATSEVGKGSRFTVTLPRARRTS